MRAPRCQVVPGIPHHFAFQIAGREVLRWNFGQEYPRPCFFPVLAPSGAQLTRMGHPGAPDHDHHQSIWFAHNKVLGINFWGNASGAVVRQLQWFALEDGADSCRMAVELGWFDGHNPAPLLRQELIAEVRPVAESGEYTVELQSRFVPTAASLEFAKTNFGFLAVRVAKSVSAFFGGGVLTSSAGVTGEKQLFAGAAEWMDYSGPTQMNSDDREGITYFDHVSNPGQPTCWHVRDDGWMCASPCLNGALLTTAETPLQLRYLLYMHAGAVHPDRVAELAGSFRRLQPLRLEKSTVNHIRWQLVRG